MTFLKTLLVPTRSPGRTPHRVLSHPKSPLSCRSSAASVGIVPHGQWAHHDELRLALIDRSAKLVEPSLCLDSPYITAIHAHLLSSRHLIFSSRTSTLALSSRPATFFKVEDQPRTILYHIPESLPFLAPPDAQPDTPFASPTASRSCVHHSTQDGSLFNCAEALTNTSFETSTMSEL